jgi:hypothetical protein
MVVTPILLTASGMWYVTSGAWIRLVITVARMWVVIVIPGRRVVGDHNARRINARRRDDDRRRIHHPRLMNYHGRAGERRQREVNADVNPGGSQAQASRENQCGDQ